MNFLQGAQYLSDGDVLLTEFLTLLASTLSGKYDGIVAHAMPSPALLGTKSSDVLSPTLKLSLLSYFVPSTRL